MISRLVDDGDGMPVVVVEYRMIGGGVIGWCWCGWMRMKEDEEDEGCELYGGWWSMVNAKLFNKLVAGPRS
ncbi:hypothetical protein QVD17_24121 [Tagetes erecta]|uniref:Uncharacterized protein n=1 Tax=Tagetes erecta TaxID=13708 RepID=A0AAD8NML7_TARER|nr:hypothetical protein QVD17_24121 [Tagetes erecta]